MDIGDIISEALMRIDDLLKSGIENLPKIEKILLDVIEFMFGPTQILKQLGMISVLQIFVILIKSIGNSYGNILMLISKNGRRERELKQKLKNASSYEDWEFIAYELDILKGNDIWRKTDESSLYDCKMLQRRIFGIQDMLERGDVFNLMFRLRGCLARDQFGIQHEGLFSRALSGTKHLVEHYHETISNALNFICDSPISEEEVSS